MKALLPALNRLIEKGVIALLIFTPLAFGTVQKWSVSLFEIGAFLLLMLFLLKGTITGFRCNSAELPYDATGSEPGGFEPLKKGALRAAVILLALFVGLVFLQLLPLPGAILRMVSPTSLQLYEKFGGATAALHSISINRYATRQELLLLLSYLSVFFVIIGHYRSKDQLRSLVKAVFYMGCFLVLFALVQKVTWNDRLFWFYPVEEYLRSGKGIWGPYINRNHFAGYLEMIIPLGLGLLIYTAPGRRSSSNAMQSNRFARFLASPDFATFTTYSLFVLVMTAALFATLSRGGIAASVVSFIFFVWISRKRRSLRSRSLLLVLMALVITAVVIFAAWDRIENRFDDGGYFDRATVWKDSLGIMRDYPLMGSGLGAFESTYLRYQSRSNRVLFDHAHNDYVEVVTDTGAVGTMLIGGALLLLFAALYRRWRTKRSTYAQCIGAGGLSATVALAVHSCTDFNLHIPANALLFTVVVAITYVAVFNLCDSRSASFITPDASPLTPHP
jgi:O-antigen ligase